MFDTGSAILKNQIKSRHDNGSIKQIVTQY